MMSTAHRILCGLLVTATAGCSVAVPVVKEAQKCAPPADLLAACEEAGAIRPGITFGELIEVWSRDRDKLKACALRQKTLADAIAECNAVIDKYNAEIRELNARNAK
jgi:hypothetical protein